MEMDFIPTPTDFLKLSDKPIEPVDFKEFGYGYLPEERNYRNMHNGIQKDKVILLFDCNFSHEVKNIQSFKQFKCLQNKFIMPEVVSYKEYINEGFYAIMRKQKEAKKIAKDKKKQVAAEGVDDFGRGKDYISMNVNLESVS